MMDGTTSLVQWAEHIAEIFHLAITPQQLARLLAKAQEMRTC
jgi:hypothetical protein